MNVIPTALAGVLIIEPAVHRDHRGFLLETWHRRRYSGAGLPEEFVQDVHSRSAPGTLRGLHYQVTRPQGKLVRCVIGGIYDVAVDIRRGSPTFGKWVGVDLTAENKRQLWIPPGFAHGYCVPTQASEVEYKCTDYYAAEDQAGVLWNDPGLGIQWPVQDPILSAKDEAFAPLSAGRPDLPDYR